MGISSLAIERCLHPPRLYRFTVARSATWWPQATLAGPAVVQVDDRDELAARGDRTDERCVEGLSADLKIGTSIRHPKDESSESQHNNAMARALELTVVRASSNSASLR